VSSPQILVLSTAPLCRALSALACTSLTPGPYKAKTNRASLEASVLGTGALEQDAGTDRALTGWRREGRGERGEGRGERGVRRKWPILIHPEGLRVMVGGDSLLLRLCCRLKRMYSDGWRLKQV